MLICVTSRESLTDKTAKVAGRKHGTSILAKNMLYGIPIGKCLKCNSTLQTIRVLKGDEIANQQLLNICLPIRSNGIK